MPQVDPNVALNAITALVVAWIGYRQAQVKRRLDQVNGRVQRALDKLLER